MFIYTEQRIKKTWKHMIERCNRDKNYRDVCICEEWQDYKNFKKWYLKNIYGTEQFRLELDKDLFSNGKRIYSPETCCFLPKSLNIKLSTCSSRNGLLPGVTRTKNGTYKAVVKHADIVKEKVFKTEIEAFEFYKEEKEKLIKIAAEAYKFLLPEKIYNALIEYEVKAIR